MRALTRLGAATVVVALLLLAGCGGGGDSGPASGSISTSPPKIHQGQKRGGTLEVISDGDFRSLDPGQAYYGQDYEVVYATQRPLYSYKPDDPEHPEPDLAAAPPQVSRDGRRVTVRIKSGVHFGPPVKRAVVAEDVKYAIERGALPSVANPYLGAYFGDLQGFAAAARGRPISGIETPDPHTIVFRLTKPTGRLLAGALVLPITAPVPPEYARSYDAHRPSDYGSHQVATGPYRIADYEPGKRLELVRNHEWVAHTDYRPAYVNRIVWSVGRDPDVAGRQILRGRNKVNGDSPPSEIVKLAVTRYDDQITFVGASANRYVTLNTSIPPFNRLEIRRAVAAALNRKAMQKTRGGPLTGQIASHFIPPGTAGFAQAGGEAGPGFDFISSPGGNLALAREYLRRAGFKDGRYHGPRITLVADSSDPANRTAQVVLNSLKELGFSVNARFVKTDTVYNLCGPAKNKVNVCPNVGFGRDFNDPETVLDVPFDGRNLTPDASNANWSQFDDPQVNRAMARAAVITDPKARARAWGRIDRLLVSKVAAIPWYWDAQANIESANVKGVIAEWNATWDLTFSSVE